jgi:hypothetical protein
LRPFHELVECVSIAAWWWSCAAETCSRNEDRNCCVEGRHNSYMYIWNTQQDATNEDNFILLCTRSVTHNEFTELYSICCGNKVASLSVTKAVTSSLERYYIVFSIYFRCSNKTFFPWDFIYSFISDSTALCWALTRFIQFRNRIDRL